MSTLNAIGHVRRGAPPAPSMDFADLLQQGIAACQALAGDVWTDFNAHDPGVTILEQLCYALTDLGYRSSYPVADMLAEQDLDWQQRHTTLFPGPRILTCNPLTIDDYRKLIIDQALAEGWPNFKNVWLLPFDAHPQGLAGLYTAQFEVLDPAQDGSELAARIGQVYRAHRNVGEDLHGEALQLALCSVYVTASVAIGAEADQNAVMAALLYQLQDALVPFIDTTGVGQALRQGVAPARIYDGPPLQGGLIADDLLQPPRTSVAPLEASAVMLAVPGVTGVTGLQMQVNGVAVAAGATAAIPPGQVARLSPSVFALQAPLPFQLLRNGAPAQVDLATVQRLLARMLAALAPAPGPVGASDPEQAAYASLPKGRPMAIADYFSIQRQFPAIYGIGSYGVTLNQPQSAAEVAQRGARVAQARQLKAYLLFFEQILADALAQMAEAGRLFSIDPSVQRSYFFQSLAGAGDGPPDVVEVLRGPQPVPPVPPTPVPDAPHYVVYVRDPEQVDTLLLRSPTFADPGAANAARQAILAQGADPQRYQVSGLPGAQYQLTLVDEQGRVLAFGAERLAGAEQARQRIAAIAAALARLAHDPALCAQCALVEERGERAVRLVDAQGVVLLDGSRLSADGQQRWVRQLLQFGVRAACYKVVARKGERWRLALGDLRGHVFARGEQEFASQQEALRQIPVLTALVGSLCCDAQAQARQIQCLQAAVAPAPAAPVADPDPRVRHYLDGWQHAVREFDPYLQRRNRILDHLLARFSERFDDQSLIRLDPRPDGADDVARDLIGWKLTFLQRYAAPAPVPGAVDGARANWLGGARSRAENASSGSGPVARIALLLGVDLEAPAWDGGHAYLDPRTDPGGAYAGQLDAAGPALRFASSDPAVLRALLRHGTEVANYRIDGPDADGRHQLRFIWPGSGEPCVVHSAASAAGAERARGAAIDYLRTCGRQRERLYGGETMHAVEHILLRNGAPLAQPAPFYSHRVSLVLPDWPARFQDPAFRAFAWQTVLDNFPGHVDVRLHWLNAARMGQFVALRAAWCGCAAMPGGAPSAAGALADFIAGLDCAVAT